MQLHLVSESTFTEQFADGTVKVSGQVPEPPLLVLDEAYIQTGLWALKPIPIIDEGQNITSVLAPPPDDVFSICRAHLAKLKAKLVDCKNTITTFTLNTTTLL